jgi:hypothetical protein
MARQAYIERVVPEIDEENASNYPIPSTKGTWVKPDLNPEQHQKYAILYALTSVVSLGLYALRR